MTPTVVLKKGETAYTLNSHAGRNLVIKDGIEIREPLYGRDYKCSLGSASVEILYDSVILNFIQTTEDVVLEIKNGSSWLFCGYLRPMTAITYSDAADRVTLEAIATASKLESTYRDEPIWITETDAWTVCNPSDTSHSLVHKLIDLTGWNQLTDHAVTVNAPAIEDPVRLYQIRRKDDLKVKLESLLWEYGFVIRAMPDGSLGFFEFRQADPSASVQLDDGNIIRSIPIKQEDPKEKGVSVGYKFYRTTTNTVNCLSRQPNELLWDNNPSSDLYKYPPHRDQNGAIDNRSAYDVKRDPGGSPLVINGQEVLDTFFFWEAPSLKGLEGDYRFFDHEVILKFKVESRIRDWFEWKDGASATFELTWKAGVFTCSGYPQSGWSLASTSGIGRPEASPLWTFWQHPEIAVEQLSVSDEGLSLRINTALSGLGSTQNMHEGTMGFGWIAGFILRLESIKVKARLLYFHHGEKDTNDETAPRVVVGNTTDKELLREDVANYLVQKADAEKLARALYRSMRSSTLTVESRLDIQPGTIVRVVYSERGLDIVGVVRERVYQPGVLTVYQYTIETIEPFIVEANYYPSTPVQPAAAQPTLEDVATQLARVAGDNGQIIQPIAGASLGGVLPEGSGLYFGGNVLGFWDAGSEYWMFKVDRLGNLRVGDSDSFVEFALPRDADENVTGPGTLTINAKLVAQLESELRGTVSIGNTIKSSGYIAGLSGWSIDGNGNAEFNAITIRGTIYSTAGQIGGWEIGSLLRSASSGARVELNPVKSRLSVFDALDRETVVVGFLEGLAKQSGGTYGAGDYGFWAREGDTLRIEGDVEYQNGNWIIKGDAELRIEDIANPAATYARNGLNGLLYYVNSAFRAGVYLNGNEWTVHADVAHIGANFIGNARVELGLYGSGPQSCYIDFHNADSPSDFTARIIQYDSSDTLNFLNPKNFMFHFEGWLNTYCALVLGTTAGSTQLLLALSQPIGNNSGLQFFHARHVDGSDWVNTSLILRRVVDSSVHGWISFGVYGGSIANYGMSFGSGDVEAFRILQNAQIWTWGDVYFNARMDVDTSNIRCRVPLVTKRVLLDSIYGGYAVNTEHLWWAPHDGLALITLVGGGGGGGLYGGGGGGGYINRYIIRLYGGRAYYFKIGGGGLGGVNGTNSAEAGYLSAFYYQGGQVYRGYCAEGGRPGSLSGGQGGDGGTGGGGGAYGSANGGSGESSEKYGVAYRTNAFLEREIGGSGGAGIDPGSNPTKGGGGGGSFGQGVTGTNGGNGVDNGGDGGWAYLQGYAGGGGGGGLTLPGYSVAGGSGSIYMQGVPPLTSKPAKGGAGWGAGGGGATYHSNATTRYGGNGAPGCIIIQYIGEAI